MADYGCLCLELHLRGNGWGVCYGGNALGHGYVGADHFDGWSGGIEYIERIMAVVGAERFNNMSGRYCRVATKGWGDRIKIIGNIVEDDWFDAKSFCEDIISNEESKEESPKEPEK